MADNIIHFTGETRLDLPPERVLAAAKADDLDTVLIIGKCKDGTLWLGSSTTDAGELFLLMERTKADFLTRI